MKKGCLLIISTLLIGIYGAYIPPSQAAEPKIDLQALLAKKVPVLVEFGSNCCSPCNYSKQLLDDLAMSYGGKAVVVGADVAVNKDLARQFKVRLTPTQVFLSADGKEFFRKEGNLPREQIIEVFSKMGLASPAATTRGHVAAPQSAAPPLPGYSTTRQ